MNAGTLQRYFIEKLKGNFNEREIRYIFFQVLEEVFGIDRINFFINKDREFSTAEIRKVRSILRQLSTNKPLQYILGTSVFCNLHLEVGPAVLIPRPETEEMVDLILQRIPFSKNKTVNILDIGTGSGCLAISLATLIKGSKVSACDIMDDALKLAARNAVRNNTDIDFFKLDILEETLPSSLPAFDLIVSNPPYVTESEKSQMKPNVLMYEPAVALFVPDDDPLKFYRVIAEKCFNHLKKKGKLFVEINEAYGQDLIKLFEHHHYKNLVIWNDIHGKDRFLEAGK